MSDLGINAAKAYLSTAQTISGAAAGSPAQQIGAGFGEILNSAVSSISNAGATAGVTH